MTATATASEHVIHVEPGGIEPIPAEHRHGSPWQLFATWTSPNMEFATIFVGFIAVAYFGLTLPQAIGAIVLGNVLGGITQGVLSTWGPREGLAQMLLGRSAFGFWGNLIPASLNTAMAGLGWFAVNSVSGAFALATLTSLPVWLALVIVVVVEVGVAYVGHDVIQLFERYAFFVLAAIFVIAGIFILGRSNPAAPAAEFPPGTFAGFTIAFGAAFGYAAGWNPYASDYTRYLPASTSRLKIALAAGGGNFVSTTFLMIVGAASATIVVDGLSADASPTEVFTAGMPGWMAAITLVAIVIGAISANALNIYSGAMSFLTLGIKIPFRRRRAIVALSFGILGYFLALWSILAGAATAYENFLLVIAYWIAPWLGVVFTDRILRRGTQIEGFVVNEVHKYRNAAGPIAFVVATVASVWLFSNQVLYTGVVPTLDPAVGDLTAPIGFLLAAGLYALLFALTKPRLGARLSA